MAKKGHPLIICGVYGLTDPRDGSIHYIGSSENILRRLDDHDSAWKRRDLKSDRLFIWRLSMQEDEQEPGFIVLEYCSSNKRYDRERFWIRQGFDNNWPLCNHPSTYYPG